MKKPVLSALILTLATACSTIPRDAYFNRGTPESLLDMSSEVVNVNIHDAGGLDELAGWINRDVPSRAELYCSNASASCGKAREILAQFGVDYRQMPEAKGSVSLYYERVMARDCENRYIDNSINPYNLNHPTFGCSSAANMVQMVSDKRQFVNPDIMTYPDGEKTVQAYRAYQKPSPVASGEGGVRSVIRGSDGKGLQ